MELEVCEGFRYTAPSSNSFRSFVCHIGLATSLKVCQLGKKCSNLLLSKFGDINSLWLVEGLFLFVEDLSSQKFILKEHIL